MEKNSTLLNCSMYSFFSFLKIVSVDNLLEWLTHLTQGSTYQSRMLLTNQQLNSDLKNLANIFHFMLLSLCSIKVLTFCCFSKDEKPFTQHFNYFIQLNIDIKLYTEVYNIQEKAMQNIMSHSGKQFRVERL